MNNTRPTRPSFRPRRADAARIQRRGDASVRRGIRRRSVRSIATLPRRMRSMGQWPYSSGLSGNVRGQAVQ
jgi:hypothetical protein